MTDQADIAIIGAGAAGLAAAIFAAEAAASRGASPRIVVLDGAKKVGAKILVAGGGRCNVTHHRISPDDYQGPRPVVRNILAAFPQRKTVEWFASLNVELKHEPTGKLFPVTDDAHTVLNALLHRCDQLHVDLRTHHRVIHIRRDADARSFIIDHSQGSLIAARLVLATGGKSLPKTGSDGAGFTLAKSLGHTVTPTYPALVPLVLASNFFHADLSGVSHEAELTTLVDNKRIDRRTGSLLWTHFGISGPVVMDASRFWVIAHAEQRRPELRCNFAPGRTFEDIDRYLTQHDPKQTLAAALAANLPKRLVDALCAHVRIDASQPMSQLPRDARRTIAHAVTDLPLPVVADRGWNYAEVTAGGVPLSEIDYRTMQSRRCENLYLIGEILDVDGRIGGFNFQWAWSTAHIAGNNLAKS